MNINIEHAESMSFNCLGDLCKLIPDSSDGKPMNYGQGEGQVKIDGTIWGIYFRGENNYNLQFEEGTIKWSDLVSLTNSILDNLHFVYGDLLIFSIEGCLNHYEIHEKFIS